MDSTIFPIGAEKHIVFCIIATILFVAQFVRTKHWYQLVMAIAVPCSLLIYVAPENKVVYYGVGVLEGILLLTAFVLSIIQARKDAKAEKEKKAAAEAAKLAEQAAEAEETPAAAETPKTEA